MAQTEASPVLCGEQEACLHLLCSNRQRQSQDVVLRSQSEAPWHSETMVSRVCALQCLGDRMGRVASTSPVSQEQGWCQTALLSLLAGPHLPDQHPDSSFCNSEHCMWVENSRIWFLVCYRPLRPQSVH